MVRHTGYEAASAHVRPAGRGCQLVRSDHAELGVPTPGVLPQQAHLGVQHGVHAHLQGFVRHQSSVHHHLVADPPVVDALADGFDDSGDVIAGDVWKRRWLGHPGGQPEVHVV